jgi:3',5'-cyclic AMP phosphodiesterase CpdA
MDHAPDKPRSRQAQPVSGRLTFAHVTDAHLTSPDPSGIHELFNKRMLGALSWRRRRRHIHRREVLEALVADLRREAPDHIAITGDLTQIGLPGECAAARAWLDELAPPSAVSLVPGNHDRYARADWSQTVGLWTPFMSPDPGASPAGDNARGESFPFLRIRGPVAFIGVSSSVVSPWLMATGTVGGAQRARLEDMLDATGRQGLFRVILIHHLPVPGADKWRKRLTDAGDLAALIRRRGAELVLHGHTHRLTENALEGPLGQRIPVIGLSSASALDDEPGREARYALWTVSSDSGAHALRLRTRVHRDGAFVEDDDWQPVSPG